MIRTFKDLIVYQKAFEQAMEIFEITKGFPKIEQYSLTDQIRRSSRSVCVNIGEAWRKTRYPAHFASKLTDADAEATASKMLVVLSEVIGDNATGTAITFGPLAGFSGLTASAVQYVSTTSGDFTEAAPTGSADIVRVAGYALSATTMFFNPGGSWVEIA